MIKNSQSCHVNTFINESHHESANLSFFVAVVLLFIVAAVVYNPVVLHRNLRRS